MRAAGILAVSAAAHVAVLAALPGPSVRIVPAAPAPTVEVEPAFEEDVTPIDVVVVDQALDSRLSAMGSQNQNQTQSGGTISHIRGSQGDLGPRVESPEPSASGAASSEGPNPFSMRNAAPASATVALVLPAGDPVLDEILNRPPPPEVPSTGTLDPNRDGSYTARDLAFTMHVNADGTVDSIEDKPNFNIHLHLPHPKKIARAIKHHLANWAEDPYGTAAGSTTKAPHPGAQDDDKDDSGETLPIISGGFDLTDAAMRFAGMDPYAARKRALLEKTFDERVQMGIAYRSQQLANADQIMLDNLKKLWARTDLSLADKREAIFELWDDCAESGGDDLVAAGQRAREALYRFIDVHVPAGADGAFSDSEVAGYNAQRRSKDTFAPYRSGVP